MKYSGPRPPRLLLALAGCLAFLLLLHAPGAPRSAAQSPPPDALWLGHTNANDLRGLVVAGGEGVVWAATGGGAVRWDVGSGTYSSFSAPDGLPATGLRGVVSASDGSLWFATARGVGRLGAEGRWTAFGRADGLADEDVLAIAAAPDGGMWFGTAGGAAYRSAAGAWRVHQRADPGVALPSDRVTAIALGADGSVWFGTPGGAARLSAGGDWTAFYESDGLVADGVTSVAAAPDGRVCFGAEGGVACRAADEAWARVEVAEGRSVTALAFGPGGDLWLGAADGLTRVGAAGARTWGRADGLPDDRVTGIGFDGAGRPWVATARGLARGASADLGVDRAAGPAPTPGPDQAPEVLDPSWTAFLTGDGLADNRVGAVALDPEGAVWFGTASGPSVLAPDGAWPPVELPGTQDASSGTGAVPAVADIAVDGSGTLWLATDRGAWRRLPGGAWERFGRAEGLPDERVAALAPDPTGGIWLGTAGGAVHHSSAGRWRALAIPGLTDQRIGALALAPDGALWLGTPAEGLARLAADGLWRRYRRADGLPGDDVSAIAFGAAGELWVGTRDGGLGRLTPEGRWQTYDQANRLPSDRVLSLAAEAGGALWVGTDAGLSLIRPYDPLQHFGIADGLTDLAVQDIALDPRGDLWLATAAGAVQVRSLRPAVPPPTRAPLEPSPGAPPMPASPSPAPGMPTEPPPGTPGTPTELPSGTPTLAARTPTPPAASPTAPARTPTVLATPPASTPGPPSPAPSATVEPLQTATLPPPSPTRSGPFPTPSASAGPTRTAAPPTNTAAATPSAPPAGSPTPAAPGPSPTAEPGAPTAAPGPTGTLPAPAPSPSPRAAATGIGTPGGGPEDASAGRRLVLPLLLRAQDLRTPRPTQSPRTTTATADGSPSPTRELASPTPLPLPGPDTCALAVDLAAPVNLSGRLDEAADLAVFRFAVPPAFNRIELGATSLDAGAEAPPFELLLYRSCGPLDGLLPINAARREGATLRLAQDIQAGGSYYAVLRPTGAAGGYPRRFRLGIGLASRSRGLRTLILTHQPALQFAFRLGPHDPELEGWRRSLAALAEHPAVAGAVVWDLKAIAYDPDGDGIWDIQRAYEDWEDSGYRDPQTANLLAGLLRDWIWASRAETWPDLRYLVIAGDDRVIPHFRQRISRPPEAGADGWLREDEYFNEGTIGADTGVGLALLQDQTLSDDFYAAPLGRALADGERDVYMPELAIGRLVERPGDMRALAESFLASDGVLELGSALVAGYDFMEDAAAEGDAVLARRGLPEAQRTRLLGEGWLPGALRKSLFATRQDLNFIAAHSRHYALETARGEVIRALDVLTATADLEGTLAYAVACHSGLSAPGGDHLAALDFAEAWARRGATFIGSTGWAYGLVDALGYQEALMADFTADLVGSEGATVGDALLATKQRYYGGQVMNHFHAKTLAGTILYGLPMLQVRLDAPPAAQEPALRLPSIGGEDARAMLPSDAVRLGPALWQRQGVTVDLAGAGYARHDTPLGTRFSLGGQPPLAEAGEPAQPRLALRLPELDVGGRGLAPRAALLTHARFRDLADFDPVIGRAGLLAPPPRPAAQAEPAFDRPYWHPARTLQLGGPAPRAGDGAVLVGRRETRLLVTAGQFLACRRRERLYDALGFDLYYSDAADREAPLVGAVEADAIAGATEIRVLATDPAGIARVAVAFTDDREAWQSLDLAPEVPAGGPAPGVWTGRIPAGMRFLVQVVDGAGNLAIADREGRGYGPDACGGG